MITLEQAVELLAFLRGEEIASVDAQKQYQEKENKHMAAYTKGQAKVYAYLGDAVQALVDQNRKEDSHV